MSEYGEKFPDVSLEASFEGTGAVFDHFVHNVAQISTVEEYRKRRNLITKKLENLYQDHELAGESMLIGIEDCETAIVDHSTGAQIPLYGSATGYVHKFYPARTVLGLDAITEDKPVTDDIATVGDAGSSWRNPYNLIDVSLGIRLRPIFVPVGFNPETTFIDVPANQITHLEKLEDRHDFLLEEQIFDAKCRRALVEERGTDVDKQRDTEEVSYITARQFEESDFVGTAVALRFHPGATYFATDDLSCVRDHYRVGGAHDDIDIDNGIIDDESPLFAKVRNFDWLWDESDSHESAIPMLMAVVELTDVQDILAYGANTISVAVGDIRFGHSFNKASRITNAVDIFKYELQLFEDACDAIYSEKLDFHREIEALGSLVGALNQTDSGNIFRDTVFQTIGSTVALKVERDCEFIGQTIEVEVKHERAIAVQSGHELIGKILGYAIDHATLVSGEEVESDSTVQNMDPEHHSEISIVCVIDVSADRYYDALGINRVYLPLEYVPYGEFLYTPSFN